MQHVENDLDTTIEKLSQANQGESKIVDLEEELRVIGENLKALEVAEEKAQQREEDYKRQIKQLTDRLKTAESRAEYGEKTVQKLNLRIDNVMSDLVGEKTKTQTVNEELDQTFNFSPRTDTPTTGSRAECKQSVFPQVKKEEMLSHDAVRKSIFSVRLIQKYRM